MYSALQAVLGAGAAGIAAAKELRAEGHTVHVLEQASTLGGTWVQDENTESDLLGQDPQRSVVHSSMYSSLRTNLPREVMSFYDYPFTPQLMKVCNHCHASLSILFLFHVFVTI